MTTAWPCGARPGELGLDPEPQRLRQWNLDNLEAYWRPTAMRMVAGRPPLNPLLPRRWMTSWVVLGPPRLHHTILTGDVIAKEDAGTYALDRFDERWHGIIGEALAYQRGEPTAPGFDEQSRHREAGRFAIHVIEDAARLP